MKKIIYTALFISILSVVSCTKNEDASASSDANISYVIISTNASKSLWEYTDKDGVTQKGSLPGVATKTYVQNVHKPFTATLKVKAFQNNINTEVSVKAFIINLSSGDTLVRDSKSLKTDSVDVTITKTLN